MIDHQKIKSKYGKRLKTGRRKQQQKSKTLSDNQTNYYVIPNKTIGRPVTCDKLALSASVSSVLSVHFNFNFDFNVCSFFYVVVLLPVMRRQCEFIYTLVNKKNHTWSYIGHLFITACAPILAFLEINK